jgi:hypothetical protein
MTLLQGLSSWHHMQISLGKEKAIFCMIYTSSLQLFMSLGSIVIVV